MKKFLFLRALFLCLIILIPSYSFAQTNCSEELNFRVSSYGSELHGELFWNHLRHKYKNYQILAFGIPLTTIDASSFYFSNAKNLRTYDPRQQSNYDRAISNIGSVEEIEFSIKPTSYFGQQVDTIGLHGQCNQPIATSSPAPAMSGFTPSAVNINRNSDLCDSGLNLSISNYGDDLHGELSWNHRRLIYKKYQVLAWGIEIAFVDASSLYIKNARHLRTANSSRQG